MGLGFHHTWVKFIPSLIFPRDPYLRLSRKWVQKKWMPLCTENAARAAAYVLTRNVRIPQYSPQFEQSEPNKYTQEYKYTQVYAWEVVVSWIWQWGDWSSHSRQTLCWVQLKHCSKNLSSKYILYKYEIIQAWCIRFKRYTQNIAQRRNLVRLYNSQGPMFTHLWGKSI